MVLFQNINYDRFIEENKNKKIICFGAGGTLKDFIKERSQLVMLMEKIEVILDNDHKKQGEKVFINNRTILVQSVEDFLLQNPNMNHYVILIFISDKFVIEVLEQLDGIKEFDGVTCIYGMQAFWWGREMNFPPLPYYPELPVINKKFKIPKTINYCWFGENEITKNALECIESWKLFCPDFKIILWNEKNYDLSYAPLYVKQAYEAKKYAFVSDYARLDILYKFGGFYLDTDVELLRGLDDFVQYKGFFAFLEYNEIATGLGFGCVAGLEELKQQMEMYKTINFKNEDGSFNLIPCPAYNSDFFRWKGIKIRNELQLVDEILFLPSSYFSPLNPVLCNDGCYNLALYALTSNSYAIHRCENSWRENDNIEAFNEKKEYFMKINQRLLIDWKRMYPGR